MGSKKFKVCSKCKVEKSTKYFGKDASKKSGVKSRCKECSSKVSEDKKELEKHNSSLLSEKKRIENNIDVYEEKINKSKTREKKDKYIDLYNEEIDNLEKIEEKIKRRTIKFEGGKVYGNLKYSKLKKLYEEQLKYNKEKKKSSPKEDKNFYQKNIDYYSNKLKNLANDFPKFISVENETFSEVIQKIKKLLKKGYVVKLEGQIKLTDSEEYKEYISKNYFSSIAQLESYVNAIEMSSDIDEMFFFGKIRYGMDKFKKVNRSKRGDGTTFQYSIKEYKGKYCYIPTENQCFLKCYKYLNRDESKIFKEGIETLYKEFCQQENKEKKVQSFIMSNAKFTRFNNFMEDKVRYYNTKDKHIYPKIKENKYEYIYYLHNPHNNQIGHYCLIYINNKKKAIKEIEENYEQRWKEIDKNLVKDVHLLKKEGIRDNEIDKRTYVYDIESYQDENGKHIPFAIASINLKLFKVSVSKYIKNEDNSLVKNLPEEKLNKLLNKHIKYFVGEDCIKQFFKYLGDKVYDPEILLYAHNGSGYDSELIIENIPLSKTPPVKKGGKLLNVNLENPYVTDKWIGWFKRNHKLTKQIKVKDKEVRVKVYPKQNISLRCTMQHVNTKLSKWGESFNIPENLRKINFEITKINKDNYKEKENEWLPYLKNDVLSLACCMMLYNEMMIDISNLNMQTSLSLPGLTFSSWMNKMNKKEEKIYSSADKYTRYFIRKSVKGGRVAANIRKFDSSLKIKKILKKYLGDENDIIKIISKYNEIDKNSEMFRNLTNELKEIDKKNMMTALDVNSLYPSAMSDLNSEYPRMESVRKFKKEEEEKILKKFNRQTFRPKTGIFKIFYEYPDDMFFTPVFSKDSVNFENKKTEILRSRTGKCCDILTSVDIQEIVRCGGTIIRIFDGLIFEENFEINPFREFVLELYSLKAKFKNEKNKVGYAIVKLLLVSLYGKMVQKDIKTKTHLWNENTLKKNYTDNVKYEKIGDDLYYVEEDIGDDLPKLLMPSHLGSFILSHSKRIMNDVILEIDGFKKTKIYYTDTDSIYVKEKCVKILEEKGYLHETDLGKLSNDLDDDGKIFYGLFLAPKIKLCYALNNKGEIVTKQTFKGYQRDILEPVQFEKMYNDEEIETEVNKPWEKKLGRGIFSSEDKQNKKFSSNVNILKRKKPDQNEIMFPYNTSEIDLEMLKLYNINPEDLYIHEEYIN